LGNLFCVTSVAKNTPTVKAGHYRAVLYVWKETDLLGQYQDTYELESQQWFRWLQLPNSKSFRFEQLDNKQTTFTARREERANDAYWYAYKKIGGKTFKMYLGKASDLTYQRLQDVAVKLSTIHNTPIKEKSYPKNDWVTSPVEPEPKTNYLTRSELETIRDELLADPALTRHGKDRGTVRKAIAAFIDQIEARQTQKKGG
jgi:hypothetical protein